MTDARVHDPVKGEWTAWAPLAARGPVWPRAGLWFYRALTLALHDRRKNGEWFDLTTKDVTPSGDAIQVRAARQAVAAARRCVGQSLDNVGSDLLLRCDHTLKPFNPIAASSLGSLSSAGIAPEVSRRGNRVQGVFLSNLSNRPK